MNELTAAVLTLTGSVFATSAAAKLRSGPAYGAFRAGIREMGLVPDLLLAIVSAVLAASEAVIATALSTAAVVAVAHPGSAQFAVPAMAAAALLMAVLTTGVAVTVHRGVRAHCQCFGSSGRAIGRAHLIRNLALLAVLGVGLTSSELSHGQLTLAAALLATATGAFASLVFIKWDDLAELLTTTSAVTQSAYPPQRASHQ